MKLASSRNALLAATLGTALIAGLGATSCGDIDTSVPFPEANGPAGVITGSVAYSGPLPCTEAGFISGAAVFFAFEENLLPPPEGLGTQPVGLNVITGEVLFSGVRDRLTFNPDGSKWCPPPGSPPVVVSGDYAISPLTPGVFEVRGFYDLDNNFNPGFGVFNLPSAGDIGGGAIENAAAALQGAPVQYRRIAIGELNSDGQRVMPPTGARVDGVAVTLGLPLQLDRPLFHVKQVLDDAFGNTDPANVVIPADYQLALFDEGNPTATESSFVRLLLGAGVQPNASGDELPAATESPFFFPSKPQIELSWRDVNHDGMLDQLDSIPETSLVAALLPLAILTKLDEGDELAAQASPSIVLQAVTLNNRDPNLPPLLQTLTVPGTLDGLPALGDEVLIALRPAVLCIDTNDRSKDGVLVNTHRTDKAMNVLVDDEPTLEASLAQQFLRPVDIQYGCLPQGRYAMNLVYSTGQAWTVPNEAGICQPGETANSDQTMCGSRPRLASQSVVVTIGEPGDPAYCQANPTPAACLPAAVE